MVESRCGIKCSECTYREEVNCPGCIRMDKPFWGEKCELKSCGEEKKLAHCGECDVFPCNMLKQFSYDKEQGDDGARIRQCEAWKSEQ